MNDAIYTKPFQFPLQVNIDGHSFDYLLTVDEIGHVHQAQALIFDLPASTQKLILGESNGQLTRKIRAHAGLFKYLVPLALADKLPTYQEQLAPLMEEINRRLQAKDLQWAKLRPVPLSDSLANQVLRCYGENATELGGLKECWENIIGLIEQQRSWPQSEVKFIGLHHAGLAADFFLAITPFYPVNDQYVFYANLKLVQSEVIKNHLLEELRDPSCTPYARGIINALEQYASDDLSLYQSVINFYNQTGVKEKHLLEILRFIRHYPLPLTQEICLDAVISNTANAAPQAVEILLSMGMAEEEIVKLQLPFFKSRDANVSRASYLSFGNYISKKHLPPAEELLEIYVQELIHNKQSNNVYEMPNIAIKAEMHLIDHLLYDLLAHENSHVRYGILHIIEAYVERTKHAFFYFLTPKMIDRYWDLAIDTEPDVARKAIFLLGVIGLFRNRAAFIDSLLEIGRNADSDIVKIQVLRSINLILHRVSYQHQIEPFYLVFLEHSYNKEFALDGLRFSPNRTFKRALWEKYKDHSTEKTRLAAKMLLEPTYRRKRVFRHRDLNISRMILGSRLYNFLQKR